MPKFVCPTQTKTFPVNPKTCISNCLSNISTWIYKQDFEFKMSIFSSKHAPHIISPNLDDGNHILSIAQALSPGFAH